MSHETCNLDCDLRKDFAEMKPKVDDIHDFVTSVRAVGNFVKWTGYTLGGAVAAVAAIWGIVHAGL